MIDVSRQLGAVVVLLACGGAPAFAALPNPLAEGLRHCAGESDQGKRLACFDALAAGLPKVEADQFGLTADIARKRQAESKEPSAATSAGRTAAADAAASTTNATATSAASERAATTGTARNGAMRSAGDPTRAEPKPANQILPGKITALRQAAGGVLVFTLDNNQVWVQADADTRFTFNVGDDVRIEHGAMGSFWLAANKGRKTKVKRVS